MGGNPRSKVDGRGGPGYLLVNQEQLHFAKAGTDRDHPATR
jgi:hypothetical protein